MRGDLIGEPAGRWSWAEVLEGSITNLSGSQFMLRHPAGHTVKTRGERIRATFLGTENMVGDKGRPVRPRSARTEKGMHINGKLESSPPATRKQALNDEGELLRKGSLQPQPGCHALYPLHSMNHGPLRAACHGQQRRAGPHQHRLCQSPADQCSLFPRHPCQSPGDGAWTQLLEGWQACQGGNKGQGAAPK